MSKEQSTTLLKILSLGVLVAVSFLLYKSPNVQEFLNKQKAINSLSQKLGSVELRSRVWKKEGDNFVPVFPTDLVYTSVKYGGNDRYWVTRQRMNTIDYRLYDPLKIGVLATTSLDDNLVEFLGAGETIHLPDFSGFKPLIDPEYFDENRIRFSFTPYRAGFQELNSELHHAALARDLIGLYQQPIAIAASVPQTIVGHPLHLCNSQSDASRRYSCQFKSASGSTAEVWHVTYSKDNGYPATSFRYYTPKYGGGVVSVGFYSKQIEQLHSIDQYVWGAIQKMIVQDNSKTNGNELKK